METRFHVNETRSRCNLTSTEFQHFDPGSVYTSKINADSSTGTASSLKQSEVLPLRLTQRQHTAQWYPRALGIHQSCKSSQANSMVVLAQAIPINCSHAPSSFAGWSQAPSFLVVHKRSSAYVAHCNSGDRVVVESPPLY